jgi:hypothetical protein
VKEEELGLNIQTEGRTVDTNLQGIKYKEEE